MASTQLVVVGAGPGGYAAAFLAADLGLSVTLVGTDPNPGGVCLYRGCIPSKALLHAAKLVEDARHGSALGLEFGEPRIDVGKLRRWKQQIVDKLTGGLGQLSRQRKVTYLQGTAAFVDAQTLRVDRATGGVQQIAFEHLILATGSRPAMVPGLSIDSPRVMDSTSALEIQDVPKTLLVVGGGYIGLEIGTVYAALGSKVTVVEMTPTLLPGVDQDLVSIVQKRMEKTCAALLVATKVVDVKEQGNGIRVRLDGDKVTQEQVFDEVLVAVGRRPNSAIAGLDKTVVELDERGFIKVNHRMQTADARIFAIGDVVGEPMLAHKASHEGRVAVEVIAGREASFEPRAIPAVVFTDPEVAWCGLTETQAKREGRPIEVARFPWAASGRAITLGRTDGLTKLLLDPVDGRVLGVGLVGPGAGELIAEGALAMEMGATAQDLALTIHPHPTLSETVMESAEVFFGHATHLYRPKRATAT
ncbi:MAG: dihydrolipoyl dehydrogenase [Acidobacteria bacterium]|nr:dihydrolipoyl dehydrogenase [Acidobacteriota bacterium]